MPETPYGRRRRQDRAADELAGRGDETLLFTRWFVKNKFSLMESFVDELDRSPDERHRVTLRRRFLKATHHAKRVLLARLVVTALLAFGVVTTAAATLLNLVWVPAEIETGVNLFIDRIAAIAGSLTLLLVILRLAFDRYLELIGVTATYTAMQMAASQQNP